MKNYKQRILAIVLILVVVLIAVGMIFISNRISTSQSVAPTAPESEPMAAEQVYVEDARCAATFTVAETCVLVPPKWSEWGECTKLCGGGIQTRTCTPGTCGGADNCNDLDGGNATKICNENVCETDISIDKKAYQDESGNTAGVYTLTQEIDAVSKNQVFVYTIIVKNNATTSAESVQIKDPLTGQNQDQITFKDVEPTCQYSASDKTVNCSTSLDAGQTKQFSFRATVSDGVANGTLIKNIATVIHQGEEQKAEKDLLVSTIVSCNHTCTSDTECGDGLICDSASGACRNRACVNITSCVCPGPTVVKPRVTVTTTPRPTILPESGILDITGAAALGGGLILTVVGILLAL